ncbi:MAG: alpha-L-fucosidase [Planctomycetota bacterium]|nr:alpha-L-fucosidase [Planctomycetota bacterium]
MQRWLTALVASMAALFGATKSVAISVDPPDYAWWTKARFGMFIHWGLYSEAAGTWNGKFYGGATEWLLSLAKADPIAYHRELQPRFDPVQFDARAIVRAAKDAGMSYIVITSKHHDGFCLFPSSDSPVGIEDTPFGRAVDQGGRGRDPLKELADACAEEGIRLGFYYSLMDWHDSDYLPRRAWDDRAIEPNCQTRYANRMKTHVRELLDGRYGKIAVLWGDGDWEHGRDVHQSTGIVEMARALQPGIIINNRWSLPGDFDTPENTIPAEGVPSREWETCMTMSESWGYTPRLETTKPTRELIRMLADIASKGGNFLLNVGPDGHGQIDPVAMSRLAEIGAWMRVNGESIRGTRAGIPAVFPWGRMTLREEVNENAVYLHVFERPASGELIIPGFASAIESVTLLGATTEQSARITTSFRGADLVVSIPAEAIDASTADSVIRLDVESWPVIAIKPVPSRKGGLFVDRVEVSFDSPPGSRVLYSCDGSEPRLGSSSSRPFTDPIVLTATTRIRAISTVRGVPSGDPFDAIYELAVPWPALPSDTPQAGLSVVIVAGQFKSVPLIDPLKIALKTKTTTLVIPPSAPADHFAAQLDGVIRIPESGLVTFWLTSDDGSLLWIDGQLVIDNDGLHGARTVSGEVSLAAGLHAIRVGYFEMDGGASLDVEWKTPSGARESIPHAALNGAGS